jgi:hypothetical protein
LGSNHRDIAKINLFILLIITINYRLNFPSIDLVFDGDVYFEESYG